MAVEAQRKILFTFEYLIADRSDCDLVERNPLKLSGVPIVRHTRVQADFIVENYESGSPLEEIADNFSISEEIIQQLLDFAAKHRNSLVQ